MVGPRRPHRVSPLATLSLAGCTPAGPASFSGCSIFARPVQQHKAAQYRVV